MGYRFYWIFGGHIVKAEEYQCLDDNAARQAAAAILSLAAQTRFDAVEVWERNRFVATVMRER